MQQNGSAPPPKSGGHRRPEAIRRSMVRTMSAVAVILAAVVTLAVAAGWMAVRAGRHQERAEAAELQSKVQLWHSYLDQAGASRQHGSQGRRIEGMEALRKAVAGFQELPGGSAEDIFRLRDEAAGLLALPDAGVENTRVPLAPDHPAVAVDPAHDLLASAAQDMDTVLVRRLSDGSEVARLTLNKLYEKKPILIALAWRPRVTAQPDGAWLTAFFKNGEMAMWSLPSGKLCLQGHPPHGGLMSGNSPAGGFSTDGRYCASFSSDEGPLNIFDLNKGTWVMHAVRSGRATFALRPDTNQIAIAAGNEVQLLNLITGAREKPQVGPMTAPLAVHTLTWSRDGTMLAGMLWNGVVMLWNMNGKDTCTLEGHTGAARALEFSPDGRTLMTSSLDGTTRWWDTGRGHLLLKSQAGCGLAYTVDGTAVVCEKNDHSIVRWPLLPSQVLHNLTLSGGRDWEIRAFDLSPDGKWFAAMMPTGVEVWDLDKPSRPPAVFSGDHILGPAKMLKNLMGHTMVFTGLTFSPDSILLLTVDGTVFRRKIADKGGGILVLEPADLPEVPLPKSVAARTASVSADGKRVFIELLNTRAGVADMAGEQPFVMLRRPQSMSFNYGPGSSSGAGRMALSGDGKLVAFGYGMNVGLTVFDGLTGREVLTQSGGGSLALFSPDSSRLLACRTREFVLLRTADWSQEAARACPGQIHTSSGAAYTGDGKLLALAIKPITAELCRGADLSKHVTLQAPVQQNIRGLRMSRDGTRLTVATSTNEVQFWDVAALRRELAALGLDWDDSAPSTVPAVPAAALIPPRDQSAWMLAAGLAAATLAAAAAAVFLLRRHRGLIRGYADAEALVEQQRSDLDRANAGLFHSEKMKSLGTLAAGMAHDFNNLLSVIRMSGKLIARESRERETVTEHAATIENAVLQGKQVVRSILGYSRAGSDDGRSRDAAAVVDDAVVLLSTEFLSGITLSLDLDRDTPPVAVPADRIEQMLLNLIINASEAMNGRGRLTILVRTAAAAPADGFILAPRTPAPWVEICVRDSGPGVPPDLARRIFEPFFTTKNAGNQRGTGLGLSMVHTIATEDGAGIALVSGPGEGAAFGIFLPPVRETPDAPPASPHNKIP